MQNNRGGPKKWQKQFYNIHDLLEGYNPLRRLATSEAHIVPGHDPMVMDRYPVAHAGAEDWIVRLDADLRAWFGVGAGIEYASRVTLEQPPRFAQDNAASGPVIELGAEFPLTGRAAGS